MKIRNGFVSNSSSSSFVVAFPKVPKNAKDVLEFMFDGKEGEISLEYEPDGLSYNQVSDIVFKDMKDGSFKMATKKDIVEILAGRYHYHTGGNILWSGRINDSDGGAWTEKCGRYYGNNQKLMDELKELVVEEEKSANELREKESQLIKKGVGIKPKYAYKDGKDPNTKKPYTAKEIKALDDYYKKSEKFRKTDKEFMEFEKNKWASYHVQWDKMGKIREKIAEEDAQNFLDDNKGKFIFIISYSDNDGAQGCTMEHGNIFRNVPHVRINQH